MNSYALRVMDPDGSAVRSLDLAGWPIPGASSPDGRTRAVSHSQNGRASLWLVSIASGEKRELLSEGRLVGHELLAGRQMAGAGKSEHVEVRDSTCPDWHRSRCTRRAKSSSFRPGG